jgi:hypothetical protein
MKRQPVAGRLLVGLLIFVANLLATPTAHGTMKDYRNDPSANASAAELIDDVEPTFRHDQTFGGIAIVSGGTEIAVVGEPSAALAARVERLRESIPVAVRPVNNSLDKLLDVRDVIAKDLPVWSKRGVDLSVWGPRYGANKVYVAMSKYTKSNEEAILASYGPESVYVDHNDIETAAAQDRTNDTGVLLGANWIVPQGVAGGDCTTWFATKSRLSSNEYVFTAGHCGVHDWDVRFATGTVGRTRTLIYSGDMDAQSIGPYAAGLSTAVWSDPNATYRYAETKALSNPVDAAVCTDGQTDREVCAVFVFDPHDDITVDGHALLDVVGAARDDNRAAFSKGDSGGPVYSTRPTLGGVNARGMIAALGKVNGVLHPEYGWYVPTYHIEDEFNVDVMLH